MINGCREKTKRFSLIITNLVIICLFLAENSYGQAHAKQALPGIAAQRLNLPGLPNFYRVSDNLFRGGQPQEQGIAELIKLGIKTVVNLRETDTDRRLLAGSGITSIHLGMFAFFPRREAFRSFLEICSDPARWPVFVHCQHGSDRAGAAVALYRVFIQKWDKYEAIREMVEGPFGFHPIHDHLKNFVRNFRFHNETKDPRN